MHFMTRSLPATLMALGLLMLTAVPAICCDWTPKETLKPAQAQCGLNDLGLANMGVFDCGLNDACQDTCIFVRCHVP